MVDDKELKKQIQQATNNFITETMDELLAFRDDLEKQYKNAGGGGDPELQEVVNCLKKKIQELNASTGGASFGSRYSTRGRSNNRKLIGYKTPSRYY